MGDMLPFAQAAEFPCALHLLILLILLFLLIRSLNNVKYGSWWPAGCCSMLTLSYLLLANTLSICLERSQIYCRSKLPLKNAEKLWQLWKGGGRREIHMVKISFSAEPNSLSHCSRTCIVAAATCSLKGGSDQSSTWTPSLMVDTPQLWLSCTCWCREGSEGKHWDLSGERCTWGWASLKPDVALWRETQCSVSTPLLEISDHFSVVQQTWEKQVSNILSSHKKYNSPASLFLLLILGQSSSLSAQRNNKTVMVNLISVSSAH